MRILSATELDLGTRSPYLTGGNCYAVNLTASAVTVQHSDTPGTGYTTAATLSASTGVTAMQEIKDLKRYVRLSAAGTAYLLPAA
jgi:hypothetical protein